MSKRSWLSNFVALILSFVGVLGVPALAWADTNCICQAKSGCYKYGLTGTETCTTFCPIPPQDSLYYGVTTDDTYALEMKKDCEATPVPADFDAKLTAAKAAVPAADTAAAAASTATSKTAYCVCKEATSCSKGFYTERQPTYADVCTVHCGANKTYYSAAGATAADATAANASGKLEACNTEVLGVPPPPGPVREYVSPNLEFPFPNLVFSRIIAQKDAQGNDAIGVNWIGEYISALYNYLLGISVTIAIVMIMVGGLQYVLAAGGGATKAAKERITNAVTGLILLFCVYLLLFLVNPALTLFQPLTLTQVQQIEEEEDDVTTGTVATNTVAVTGAGLLGDGLGRIPTELGPKLQAAGVAVQAKGYSMYVTSSFRSVQEQINLITRNCQNPPGSATCNPKPGRPTTCILKNNLPANCPHTTGRALDIWGWKTGGQCISLANCLKDKTACRADPCQGAVIAAMKSNGFCNLASEPWHFEQPKMSTTCN